MHFCMNVSGLGRASNCMCLGPHHPPAPLFPNVFCIKSFSLEKGSMAEARMRAWGASMQEVPWSNLVSPESEQFVQFFLER